MDEDDSNVMPILFALLPNIARPSKGIPCRNSSLQGNEYYNELMDTGSISRFRQVARMDKHSFTRLLDVLINVGLKSSSIINAGEKLMIFLFTLNSNSNRTTQERFQHSGETISRIIHEVVKVMLTLQTEYIRMPDGLSTPSHVVENSKFYPYFQDCIGALDGTHIPVSVPISMEAPFRNRKVNLSQNVLACCRFDMVFCYILCGWEGSAHDGRVLQDAFTKGFVVPNGKYFLGDAGYGLSSSVLTPYRSTRYHLKEWNNASERPQNHKELFNLRHSQLRNVIERSFGVIKKRFPILTSMPSFEYSFQIKITLCCFILHNFVKKHQEYQDEYDYTINNTPDDGLSVHSDDNINDIDNEFRDDIARRMWQDYQSLLRNC